MMIDSLNRKVTKNKTAAARARLIVKIPRNFRELEGENNDGYVSIQALYTRMRYMHDIRPSQYYVFRYLMEKFVSLGMLEYDDTKMKVKRISSFDDHLRAFSRIVETYTLTQKSAEKELIATINQMGV